MTKRKVRNSTDWVLCGYTADLTPQKLAIWDAIERKHATGAITTEEAYRQFKYFGIPVIRECDIPY